MRTSHEIFLLLTGVLLLTLDAKAVQLAQNTPQNGSGVGPATSSSPVTTPPDASGRGTLPEDVKDDQTQLPQDGDKDRTMLPEDATDSPPATGQAPPGKAPPAPAAPTPNATLASSGTEGCWARLYDAENFIGPNVTLVGPAEMPDMQGSFRSIEVGPRATVILFDEDHFANESSRFEAGARTANLRGAGDSDDFESLRLDCSKTAR